MGGLAINIYFRKQKHQRHCCSCCYDLSVNEIRSVNTDTYVSCDIAIIIQYLRWYVLTLFSLSRGEMVVEGIIKKKH